MGRITTRVREADRDKYNAYMRKYYAIPGNAAKHKRLMAEYGARPEVKERRARLARERYSGTRGKETISERRRKCARCGAAFQRNKRGRVRIYCTNCVKRRGQSTVAPGGGIVGRPSVRRTRKASTRARPTARRVIR